VEQRIKIGARYQQLLADLPGGARTVTVRPDRDSVWAQFTVMVPNREAVIARLKEAGIPTAVHYPRPIHAQPAYAQFCAGENETPVSDQLAARVMSLPMHPDLDDATQDTIIAALRAALSH
jgi:UDP-2-acetamido-2-deoxy-ribo-hexuluronate aminotransferase